MMVAANASGSFWNPIRSVLTRIPRLFVGTSGMIGMLGAIQWSTIGLVRPDGQPAPEPKRQVVVDFSRDTSGSWGVSRTLMSPAGTSRQPLRASLYLHDLSDLDRPRRLDADSQAVHFCVLSPSGTHVALSTQEGEFGVIDLRDRGGTVRWIPGVEQDWIARLHWSPDSDRILAATDHSILCWSLPALELEYRLPLEVVLPPCLAMDDGGRHFVAWAEGRLQLCELQTGQAVREFPMELNVLSLVYAQSSGVVVTSGDEGVVATSIEDGKRLWQVPPSPALKFPIASSNDEEWLAYVVREFDQNGLRFNRVVVCRLATGETVTVIEPRVGEITGIDFSRDGTMTVWGDWGAIVGRNIESGSELWRYEFPIDV